MPSVCATLLGYGISSYPSNLTDAEWVIVSLLVPKPKTNGRRATISRRSLLNAMFYVTKAGCGWEWLPHEFPNYKTVYHYFRLWRLTGLWQAIHTILREMVRQALGRNQQPSAAIIDSRSVKTTGVGDERGYDGGKKINDRKRHLGSTPKAWCWQSKCMRPTSLIVMARHGCFLAGPLPSWDVEIVKHWWTGIKGVWVGPGQEPPTIPSGFHVLPKRWIVEHSLAWLGQNRRLSKDYERLTTSSEAFIYLAILRLMGRRLAHLQAAPYP